MPSRESTDMHPLVALAKEAIEQYIKTGKKIKKPEDFLLPDGVPEKAGVFVCLKVNGQLRGCIGTIEPSTDSTPQEAIRNAIASATEDPRFPPVGEHELDGLDYSLDVLYPPERIEDESELDPKKYGVIVSRGTRRGLLLPDLEGVDAAREQVRIAKLKAGISPTDKDVQLYRFRVERFK
jgi:AmmeMemoRadiSam system protein A